MRKTTGRTLIAAIAVFGAMTTAGWCQDANFQMEEQDCQGDALRFCGPEIPDREKIRQCLVYYKADISPACRELVAPQESR
jgi:hypothetical protein